MLTAISIAIKAKLAQLTARFVRITPTAAPQRRAGTLKGIVEVPPAFFEPLPEVELRRWEGS